MSELGCWTEVSPLGDLLVKNASLYPERIALALPDVSCTYGQLLDRAIAVGRGLLAIGVRPGQNVGLMAGNSIEYVEAFYGLSILGCVAVPLNIRHRPAELSYIIKNADLVALMTTSDADAHVDFAELLCGALPSLRHAGDPTRLSLPEAPLLHSVVSLRGSTRPGLLDRAEFDARAKAVATTEVAKLRERVKVRDIAAIMYTSGTTAHPKGCMLSHEALTRGPVERAKSRFVSGRHDVHWGAGPLFHIGSFSPLVGALGAGCTYVTDTHFDPVRAVQLLSRKNVTTIWPWFHAIVQGLLDQPGFNPVQLPHLKSIILIVAKTLAEAVHARFPAAELLQGCGMTETAGIFGLAGQTDTIQERTTTQGKAYPGVEVRIVDMERGTDVEPGDVGEILVRGYCVTSGYYKDPKKTAEALDDDNWLHTGDLYRQSPEGNLVFNGRLKDMLKVGGENVAAIEVEEFLCSHPSVRTAAIIGMPDSRLDEVPVAFVERQPEGAVTAHELIEFCRGRISSFKIPRAVHFVDGSEWPMSATKIDKRGLHERLKRLLENQ